MNKQMEDFVDLYMQYNDAQRAYMESYGNKNKKSSAVCGCRLLKRDDVKNEIERRRKALRQKHQDSLENMIEDLFDIVNVDVTEFANIVKKTKKIKGKDGQDKEIEFFDIELQETKFLTKRQKGVLKSIEFTKGGGIRAEKYDKLKAISLLCQIYGLNNVLKKDENEGGKKDENVVLNDILSQLKSNSNDVLDIDDEE
jgi:hypothetical protein